MKSKLVLRCMTLLMIVVLLAPGKPPLPAVAQSQSSENSTTWQETVITTTDPFPWTNQYLLATGDADNDSTTDIAVGTNKNFHRAELALYRRSGTTWTTDVIVQSSSSFNAIAGIAIGDADNDGLNELAYGLHKQYNFNGGPLYLKGWTGSGWSTETVFGGIGDWSYAYAIADPDNDGRNEIVSSVDTYGYGQTHHEPWLFEYDNGAWTHESLSSIRMAGPPPQATIGDVDGDGVVELVRLKEHQEVLPHYRQVYSVIDWTGTWQEVNITEIPPDNFGTLGEGDFAIDIGDLDGDSRDEFVLAYWEDTDGDDVKEGGEDSVVIRVVEYEGGSWQSTDIASYPKPGTWAGYALAVGDADNDGRDEIYVAGEDGVIRVYAYQAGNWVESQIPSSFSIPWWNAVVDDVDDDGYQDLLLVGRALDGSEFAMVTYTSLGQSDTTPPAAVTDLTASTGTVAGSVDLSWTAPGDDGNTGTATQYDVRYSASPINATNWSFATQVSGEPLPGPSGTAEQMTVNVPFSGQKYYFAIKTADEEDNWSGLSNVASAVSGQAADTTPPGRIRDLKVLPGSAAGEVLLEWTASGDDGYEGTADRYWVKHGGDKKACDENWWRNSAYNVSGEPDPLPAGTPQGMIVTGLHPGAKQRFGIRAIDDAENRSWISCVVIEKVPSEATFYPDLQVTSLSVEPGSQYPGGYIDVTLTVRNDGQSAAAASSCAVYLAESKNGPRTRLKTVAIASLGANGGQDTQSLSAKIPASTRPGSDIDYFIVAHADPDNDVTELDPNNNSLSEPFTVIGPKPDQIDLSIKDVEVSQGIQVLHLDDDPKYHKAYGPPPWCEDGEESCQDAWPWRTEGPGNGEVRLVRGRTTMVRVFVIIKQGAPEQDDVEVELEYKVGTDWESESTRLMIMQKTDPAALRNNADLTANFLIPGEKLGTELLELRVAVEPPAGVVDPDTSGNSIALALPLHRRDDFRVLFQPLQLVTNLGQDLGKGEFNPYVQAYRRYLFAALPFADEGLEGGLEVGLYGTPYTMMPINLIDCQIPVVPVESLGNEFTLAVMSNDSYRDFDVVVGIWPDSVSDKCKGFSMPPFFSIAGRAASIGKGDRSVIVTDHAQGNNVAHELGHLVPGLPHPWDNQRWPYEDCVKKECKVKEVGVAVQRVSPLFGEFAPGELIQDTQHKISDLMDYLEEWHVPWVSPYSWEAWMTKVQPSAQKVVGSQTDHVVVSGLVYTDSTTIIDPLWRSDGVPNPPLQTGSYCVQTLTSLDTLISEQCFALDFFDHDWGAVGVEAFLVSLPYSTSADKVQLVHSDTVLSEVEASASPPTVTVTYPNGGEVLTQATNVSWAGTDPDDDELHYQVYYSPDDGMTWSLLTSNTTETTFLVNPADLPGTESGLFRVTVSDGFHNAEDWSDATFTVMRKTPVVSIGGNLEGGSVPLNQTITLDAFAYDAEDGAIENDNISWMSNLGGALGTGSVLHVSDLSPGVHQITVAVTDSDGMTATHSVYTEVMADEDGDGMPDPWERSVGLDPTVDDADEDPDEEGITNILELRYGTDPILFDTDYDGHDDLTEILRGSDPADPDSVPPPAVAQLLGTVTLQGRPSSPHPAWITSLQISLYEPDGTTPLYTYQATTDENGQFDVSDIPADNYDIRIKGSHTLANIKRSVVLEHGSNAIDFGTLLEGDANDDNAVTILDYSILRTAYGTVNGQPGYDERADFNQDGAITILDYSLLRTNYGLAGE